MFFVVVVVVVQLLAYSLHFTILIIAVILSETIDKRAHVEIVEGAGDAMQH